MKKIYVDSVGKCFPDYREGTVEVETSVFDNLPKSALKYFLFIPPDEKVCPDGFCQCVNTAAVDALSEGYQDALLESTTKIVDMQSALEVLGVQP